MEKETLNADTLARAIAATFARRKMSIPTALPIGLTDEFANDPSRQGMWLAFLKKHQLAITPLLEVVATLRTKLAPVLIQASPLVSTTGTVDRKL